MANSKLLKEAIADAKAVRETAIANAKIALEEAFTPRLQSILSKKLQAEMEGDDEEVVDETDTSGIGVGTNVPTADANDVHIDLGADTEEETAEVGEEDENAEVVSEEDEMEMDSDDEMMEDEEEMEFSDMEEEDDMMGDDELDLESIIRELESELEEEDEDGVVYDPTGAIYNEEEMEMDSDEEMYQEEEEDDVIDLEEILREMGYGGDDEEVSEEDEMEMDTDKMAEMEAELEEAYNTIKSLRGTINEVNILNAKLLYANKLFRGYNLTNEQKVKIVENLDRTTTVREIKLVYATLAESMKFGGVDRKQTTKRVVSEGIASKVTASTAPKKEIIAESNELAKRFKKLAGII
jgi:hypothetical protein